MWNSREAPHERYCYGNCGMHVGRYLVYAGLDCRIMSQDGRMHFPGMGCSTAWVAQLVSAWNESIVSIVLTCPSAHPTYLKIHFRITRTVNPQSQLYINRKFQKYISVSICHCHSVFYESLFIPFKNDDGVISWYILAL